MNLKIQNSLNDLFLIQERSDVGQARGPANRGRGPLPDFEVAPGCSVAFATPFGQSPFVQIHLPRGFKFEGKSSRAVSYVPESGPLNRGTTRLKSQAQEIASAWSWRWFSSLDHEKKQLFQAGVAEPAEPAAKKRGSEKCLWLAKQNFRLGRLFLAGGESGKPD